VLQLGCNCTCESKGTYKCGCGGGEVEGCVMLVRHSYLLILKVLCAVKNMKYNVYIELDNACRKESKSLQKAAHYGILLRLNKPFLPVLQGLDLFLGQIAQIATVDIFWLEAHFG
jgi:hypothetical protein